MSIRRVRLPLLVVAAAALVGGCTFERRAEADSGDLPGMGAEGGDEAPSAEALAEDSLMVVVDAFHQALAAGDASRVASLIGPDALLVDQEEGVLWSAQGTGPLPSSMEAGDVAPNGLRWERIGTRVDRMDDVRLVMLRYRAAITGESVPWWGVETLVLQPDAAGSWRIHYMHRSRGPGGS